MSSPCLLEPFAIFALKMIEIEPPFFAAISVN
jgi:hypothetical protein